MTVLRQRLRLRHSPAIHLGRAVIVLLALALIFYGAMVMALAFKVDAGSINAISGYRDAYEYLSGLTPGDVAGVRGIVAAAGVVVFVLCGYLALKQIPKPYLTRHDLPLQSLPRGETVIEPRAIERLAEVAAIRHRAVSSAAGRYGTDELSVGVEVRRARELADTLRDVQRRVVAALRHHELPDMPVDVTLTGFDRQQQRELR